MYLQFTHAAENVLSSCMPSKAAMISNGVTRSAGWLATGKEKDRKGKRKGLTPTSPDANRCLHACKGLSCAET